MGRKKSKNNVDEDQFDDILDDDIEEDDDEGGVEFDEAELNDDEDQFDVDDEGNIIVDIDDKKKVNKGFAKIRMENKELKKQLDELKKKQTPPATPQTPSHQQQPNIQAQSQNNYQQYQQPDDGFPKTEEEWDALADKDWKRAVDLRSKLNAKRQIEEATRTQMYEKVLTESKQKVLSRHPELNDPNSEKSKIMYNILQQNPEYVSQPKGPVWAMRDMEDYMSEVMGYKPDEIVSAENRGREKESERQKRIKVTSTSGRVPTSSSRSVRLTKDEEDFCKVNGIDVKEYAKNKLRMSKGGDE